MLVLSSLNSDPKSALCLCVCMCVCACMYVNGCMGPVCIVPYSICCIGYILVINVTIVAITPSRAHSVAAGQLNAQFIDVVAFQYSCLVAG